MRNKPFSFDFFSMTRRNKWFESTISIFAEPNFLALRAEHRYLAPFESFHGDVAKSFETGPDLLDWPTMEEWVKAVVGADLYRRKDKYTAKDDEEKRDDVFTIFYSEEDKPIKRIEGKGVAPSFYRRLNRLVDPLFPFPDDYIGKGYSYEGDLDKFLEDSGIIVDREY